MQSLNRLTIKSVVCGEHLHSQNCFIFIFRFYSIIIIIIFLKTSHKIKECLRSLYYPLQFGDGYEMKIIFKKSPNSLRKAEQVAFTMYKNIFNNYNSGHLVVLRTFHRI